MRPIKLTMNAFGSFLETTIIDFETLNNAGFYLVTGETGSGKAGLLFHEQRRGRTAGRLAVPAGWSAESRDRG